MSLHELPPHDDDGNLQVVVESPGGSRMKLEFDPDRRAFVTKHVLPRGLIYPFPWGFVPGTRASDGDPLDAMLYFDAPTWPGLVIPCRPIGVVAVRQRETKKAPWVRNDRVIAVPADEAELQHVKDLPKKLVGHLEAFFVRVGELSHAEVRIDGWKGPHAAADAIESARKAVK